MAMLNAADSLVFDRKIWILHRDRAAKSYEKTGFLKDRAAQDLCERLTLVTRTFEQVLDVGAHHGAFRTALQRDPIAQAKIGNLVECDMSSAMLTHAKGPKFCADEEALPLMGDSLDLIVSSLSMHWINDLPGFLTQSRLALKPNGLFLGAMLGGRTLQELRDVLATAESEAGYEPQPRISPFADAQDGARLLQRAGFALPVADSDVVTVRYDSVFGLFRDLKAMGETSAFASRAERPLTRTIIARAADLYAERYSDSDHRIRATFEIITLTGWAPHDSQQKPLRPGSAKMRLADALGVQEIRVDDKPQ